MNKMYKGLHSHSVHHGSNLENSEVFPENLISLCALHLLYVHSTALPWLKGSDFVKNCDF